MYLWNELRSKVKVKVIQSCMTLCDPMDYTDSKSLFCYLIYLQVLHKKDLLSSRIDALYWEIVYQ